jgi:tRNA dimethylallyltransferase
VLPSPQIPVADRAGIPHHLIDILPPEAEFSAGDFYEAARRATADVLSRGRTPVVVGGTGFYLRWFVHGKPDTPRSEVALATAAQAALEQVCLSVHPQRSRYSV